MARPPALGSILEFMREIWGVDHALQSLSKRMEAQHGVTGPQRLVIRVIGKFPGISAGELADILCIHPSTLSGILRRLEANGALKRESHPRDGRRAQLSLSPEGERLDQIKTGTVEAAIQGFLETLPASRINAVSVVLRGLTAELGAELAESEAATARPGVPRPRRRR